MTTIEAKEIPHAKNPEGQRPPISSPTPAAEVLSPVAPQPEDSTHSDASPFLPHVNSLIEELSAVTPVPLGGDDAVGSTSPYHVRSGDTAIESLDSEIQRMSQQADNILESIRQEVHASPTKKSKKQAKHDIYNSTSGMDAGSIGDGLSTSSSISKRSQSSNGSANGMMMAATTTTTNRASSRDAFAKTLQYHDHDDDEDDDLSQEMERLESVSAELAISFREGMDDLLDDSSSPSDSFAGMIMPPASPRGGMSRGDDFANDDEMPRQHKDTNMDNGIRKSSSSSQVLLFQPPNEVLLLAVTVVWACVILLFVHGRFFMLDDEGIIQPPSLELLMPFLFRG